MRLSAKLKESDKPVRIFMSYSHRDEHHRVEIEKYLGILARTNSISIWNDRCIKPGAEWESTLEEELKAADVILLLISPDFIISEYCWNTEMARAIERHRAGKTRVLPILVRKVAAFELAPFSVLQMIPRDGRAVVDFTPHRKGYERVASELVPAMLDLGQATLPPHSEDLGASLRVEARLANDQSVTSPSTNIVWLSEAHSPPCLKVLKVPLNAPQQISFEYDVGDGNPTNAEAEDVESRLGRYFMTAFVVRGEDLNVNLSPFEENCGVPDALKRTELGRDLLRQDLELKRLSASLLHPQNKLGGTFWKRILGTLHGEPLSAVFRVWITVGSASVHEETVANEGRVTLKNHGPEVLCDLDYHHSLNNQSIDFGARTNEADRLCLETFKELILPHIKQDVLTGRRFGLLRQMHSAVALSAWYRKRVGHLMTGVIDSNRTADFNLDLVQPDTHLQEEYLRIFDDGLWKAYVPRYDKTTGKLQKTELITGAIQFGISTVEWLTFKSSRRIKAPLRSAFLRG